MSHAPSSFKTNATPYALFMLRTIPLPLLDKVEELTKIRVARHNI